MDLNILGKSNKELGYLLDGLEGEQSGERIYYNDFDNGVIYLFEMKDKDTYLSTVFYFGELKDDYNIYEGALPFDITFNDSLEAICDKLKTTEVYKKGEGFMDKILGKCNAWIKFKVGDYFIRFEYDNDKIVLITVSIDF